jgi:hypothetical protein
MRVRPVRRARKSFHATTTVSAPPTSANAIGIVSNIMPSSVDEAPVPGTHPGEQRGARIGFIASVDQASLA